MTYTVRWHPKTKEFLLKCEKSISERIAKKVDSIIGDPLIHTEYLPNYRLYKLRVGDWRVLMDVDQTNDIIEVLFIDHRSRIYKRL